MQTNWKENRIILHGHVEQEPQRSHVNHDETYYSFPLVVSRLSGTEDRLNLLLSETLLRRCPLVRGDEVSVQGEVRSFNNRSGVGSRLVITVYVRQLVRERGEDENHLQLSGTLCKPPIYRHTPLGRDICDMMLAVNRRYGRSDYLPCITWGTLARHCAQLEVGQRLSLEGRLQSRCYIKRLGEQTQQRTAFEISVMSLSQPEEQELPEGLKPVFREKSR